MYQVDQFLQVLRESDLMKKAHEAMGHLNLEASEWVAGEGGQQRNVKYALSRQQCCFGTSVSVVQLATRDMSSDRPTWCQLEEVITLHDVPFGDHFNVWHSASPATLLPLRLCFSCDFIT